jgi:plasmid stabilization system protein ParE
MDCKVIWTAPALEDLKEIVVYISGDNPEAARRVGMDIYDSAGDAGFFPPDRTALPARFQWKSSRNRQLELPHLLSGEF